MPTVTEAIADLKSRLEAGFTACPLRWQNETAPLPDDPSPFVYVEFLTEDVILAAFGGGAGENLWRTVGRVEAHAMVPTGTGLAAATTLAEQVAALLRGWRSAAVSCFAARVDPGDASSEDGNYYGSTAIVDFSFDQIG